MCGIVSIIHANKAVEEPKLIHMRDNLVHRGPDAAGLWCQKNVGFGQRRVSIIDLSTDSDQPFLSSDERYVLNYNGEIYNYIELRELLETKDIKFRTHSDTEVLLNALIYWGVDALEHLNGMFAFTFWDRVEQKLIVARDRFGEKPLYYHCDNHYGFAAASEMKALLADETISDAIDEFSIEQYQIGQYYEERDNTFFKHIKRLKPAHFMIVDKQGRIESEKRYWTPNYEDINHGMSKKEAVEGFGEKLNEAIRIRLRSDVQVGSSLSGGMDSSAIVGRIAQIRKSQNNTQRQNTFSARFDDDPTLSEGEFIDSVIERTGVNGFDVSPDPLKMVDELKRLHWHQEEPFLSASIYLQWCVARLASENNTTVMLDGQGADELLGGYQPYFRNHQLDLIDNGHRLTSVVNTIKFNSRLNKASRLYRDAKRRFNPNVAFSFAQICALQSVRPSPYGMPVYEEGVPPISKGFRARRQMAEALQYNTLPVLLRYADRNSMAFSREARLPFLDKELVEFAISIPDKWLFADGWQKYPLRQSSKAFLPSEVCWRADKVGYAAPLDIWMRNELKDWSYDKLFNGESKSLDYFNEDELKKQWHMHQKGQGNFSWSFWKWISLNEWFEMHAGGDLRRPHY